MINEAPFSHPQCSFDKDTSLFLLVRVIIPGRVCLTDWLSTLKKKILEQHPAAAKIAPLQFTLACKKLVCLSLWRPLKSDRKEREKRFKNIDEPFFKSYVINDGPERHLHHKRSKSHFWGIYTGRDQFIKERFKRPGDLISWPRIHFKGIFTKARHARTHFFALFMTRIAFCFWDQRRFLSRARAQSFYLSAFVQWSARISWNLMWISPEKEKNTDNAIAHLELRI